MMTSGTFCAVRGCGNDYLTTRDWTGEKAVTYFRCPKDETLKQQWVKACQRTIEEICQKRIGYVCSNHFSKDVMIKDKASGSVSLRPNSIPTLNIPLEEQPVKDKASGSVSLRPNSIPTLNIPLEEQSEEIKFLEVKLSDIDQQNLGGVLCAMATENDSIVIESPPSSPSKSVNQSPASGMYVVKTAGGSLLKAAMVSQGNTNNAVLLIKADDHSSKSPVKVLPPSVSTVTPVTKNTMFQKKVTARKSTTGPHILKKPMPPRKVEVRPKTPTPPAPQDSKQEKIVEDKIDEPKEVPELENPKNTEVESVAKESETTERKDEAVTESPKPVDDNKGTVVDAKKDEKSLEVEESIMTIEDSIEKIVHNVDSPVVFKEPEPKITEEELLVSLTSPDRDEEDEPTEDAPDNSEKANKPEKEANDKENDEAKIENSSAHPKETEKLSEATNKKSAEEKGKLPSIEELPKAVVLLSKYELPPNTTTVFLSPDSSKTPGPGFFKSCCSPDCKNSQNRRSMKRVVTFHSFPKDLEVRKKWIEWTGVPSKIKDFDSLYICSDHFSKDDYEEGGKVLKADAVPARKFARTEQEAKNVERLKKIIADFDAKRTGGNQQDKEEKEKEAVESPVEEVDDEIISEKKSPKSVKKQKNPVESSPSARKTSAKESESDESSAPQPKRPVKRAAKLTGIRCCVEGCPTKQGDGYNFYPFPNEKPVRNAWLRASKHQGAVSETTAVCSKHFVTNDFVIPSGSNTVSSRLKRGTIPSKLLPDQMMKRRAQQPSKKHTPILLNRSGSASTGRKRKILRESSSEDESSLNFSTTIGAKPGSDSAKKAKTDGAKPPKLGKKIEIIAELEEDDNGKSKKSYKVIIKKIRRKGVEGERRRGLLMDCKNSLLLVKKIVEGLDINRMKEVKFKPGDIEESQVVLTASNTTTPTSATITTAAAAPNFNAVPNLGTLIRLPGQNAVHQLQLNQLPQFVVQQQPGQQPLLVLRQFPVGQTVPTLANPPPLQAIPIQSVQQQPQTIQITTPPKTNLNIPSPSKPSTIIIQQPKSNTPTVQTATTTTTVTRTKSTPMKLQPDVTGIKQAIQSKPETILPDTDGDNSMDVDDPIENNQSEIDLKEMEKTAEKTSEEIENDRAKSKLGFELQRYKATAHKQGGKIKLLQHSKKKLEKQLQVLKRTLDLVRKDGVMCLLQPDEEAPLEKKSEETLTSTEVTES